MQNQPFDSLPPFQGRNSERQRGSNLIVGSGDDEGMQFEYAPQLGQTRRVQGREHLWDPQPHSWNSNYSNHSPIPGNSQQGYPSSTPAFDSNPLGLGPQHGSIQDQYGYPISTAVLDNGLLDPGYGELQPEFSQGQYWDLSLIAVPDYSFIDPGYGELQPEFSHNQYEQPLPTAVPGIVPMDMGYGGPQPGLDYNQTDTFGSMSNLVHGFGPMSVGIPTAVSRVNEAPPNPVLQPVTVLAPRGGVSPIVNDNRIPCPEEWCTVTFGRIGERNRHMRKHLPHKFRCKHSGCNKTFYRPDKLRDHYRQGHKDADPLLNQYVGH